MQQVIGLHSSREECVALIAIFIGTILEDTCLSAVTCGFQNLGYI